VTVLKEPEQQQSAASEPAPNGEPVYSEAG
jgi:hypothetical protein